MRIFQAACVFLAAFSAVAQQQYVPYLQQKLLAEVAECSTTACVDAVVAKAPYVDPPLRLIAASAVQQIDSAVAGPRLVDAIPSDPVAFWFCYSVTVPAVVSKSPKVRTLYDLYFPAAAAAVARTGTHVRDFLLLQAFADGDVAETIAEDIESIHEKNPAAYCKAVGTLHTDVQRQLPTCGVVRRESKK